MFGRKSAPPGEEAERELADGDVIFEEGELSREMYVIQEGSVVVTMKAGAEELVLGVLGRGDFFGEMALIESLPRSATARARGKVKLLAVQPGGFLLKIRRDPTFAFELLQQMSRRIRSTNERLLALQGRRDIEPIVRSGEFTPVEPAKR